jgi:polysaccharide pyruvyl transferase WcaK-like protein
MTAKAVATLVRDRSSYDRLRALGVDNVEIGGCPTMFLVASHDSEDDRRVLLSLRHPNRMSVPPPLQWRVADDVRRLISALGSDGDPVFLTCHDYADLEFAAGFPDAPRLYFDDVHRYLEALRRCRLSVTYRLHAFLPCLAFGTPSIHLSYDERGRETVGATGMGDWDIDLLHEPDPVEAVMARRGDLGRYHELRRGALPVIAELRATTDEAFRRFAEAVAGPGWPPGGTPLHDVRSAHALRAGG